LWTKAAIVQRITIVAAKATCWLAIRNSAEIGVGLSEEDQLDPEQSTSAIVVHHPQAKYFSV
jgi:cobalamin-dependent methionine synthase I